ncbi:MAG: cobyric acid synthase [Nocardioidaceae bacterium]
MGSLLVAGTTSDAGKTVVVTGLCRALARRGVRVAPYKAQNMSNNSMVTRDGAEIGRAQWIQAVAAHAEPEVAMNPVLLKPGSDRRSHVVVNGRPDGELSAAAFAGQRGALAQAAFEAYDDLRKRYDVVVCEGAGSPAEINLREWDYVNMGLARHGHIPTVLVGDIDRGGVFAAMYGTVALLEAADQALIGGMIVNRFRGDERLLRPGLATLEQRTGRPVLGVVPWLPELWLDAEDALAVEARPPVRADDPVLRVAVVRLPRISNFTDIDALCLEPGLEVRYVSDPRRVGDADIVVVPGTRATIADLAWMRARGLAEAVADHADRGGVVLGICGGMQLLGREIDDPHGIEGPAGTRVDGLGLVDVRTEFTPDKRLGLPSGHALGAAAAGYEIHHGRITLGAVEPFLDGARDGAVFTTMWHGSLEGDEFRRAWLNEVAALVGRTGYRPSAEVSFGAAREARIDALADALETHVDLDAVLGLIENGVPELPVLPGGHR